MRTTLAVLIGLSMTVGACGQDGADDSGSGTSESIGSTTSPSGVALGEPAPSGVANRTLEVDGRTRRYRLYVPYELGEDAVPLVIALHGNGTDGDEFAEKTGFDATAQQEGFVVVYPDAADDASGVWNGGFSRKADGIDDVSYLAALVDDLAVELPIDRDRVYATGFSSGGMMAYRLACEAPDLVAAVAPMSATMVVDCDPEATVPILHVHGLEDPGIPFDGREDRGFPSVPSVVERWSEINGCAAGPDAQTSGSVSTTAWRDCDLGADVELYAIDGMGHQFARTDEGAPIDARDVAWEFFRSHPRSG